MTDSQTKMDARAFFRQSVLDYDALHYGERSLMSVRLACMLRELDALQLAPGANILDAGCGPGRLLAELLRRGHRVTGIDTSRQMLALARGITEGRSRLAQASVESLPFPDGAFDVVCTAGVFEYLPADRAGLRELRRVLAPGGWLLFPITNLWSPAGYLDFAVEFFKRRKLLLDVFNTIWARNGRTAIRPRYFPVRKQRPSQIRSLLRESDFELHRECYFHFLGLPHPFDRLLPRLSNALGRRLEGLASTPLRGLGEGWLSVSRAGDGRSLGTNG